MNRPTEVSADRSSWRWLLAQLAVVFLGVYSAFFLDGCRERAEMSQRREQIVNMLAQDFADAAEQVDVALVDFDYRFAQFFTEYEAGKRPYLRPIPLPTLESIDTWGSILAAGGLELLDVELIREIEKALYRVKPLAAAARDYNAYVREILVPALDRPQAEFYRDDGRVQNKYLWYVLYLEGFRRGLVDMGVSTRELDARLALRVTEH